MAGQLVTPNLRALEQPYYYAHRSCGLGIAIGYRGMAFLHSTMSGVWAGRTFWMWPQQLGMGRAAVWEFTYNMASYSVLYPWSWGSAGTISPASPLGSFRWLHFWSYRLVTGFSGECSGKGNPFQGLAPEVPSFLLYQWRSQRLGGLSLPRSLKSRYNFFISPNPQMQMAELIKVLR